MPIQRMDYYCYWEFLWELSHVHRGVFITSLGLFSRLRNPIQTHS
jgi:hypothetical protein